MDNDLIELIDLYETLSPELKKQMLSIANIIRTSQIILTKELKNDEILINRG